MSGAFITLDKDLGDDPRTLALAEHYADMLLRRLATLGISLPDRNASRDEYDSLRGALRDISRNAVVGVLFNLWRYADTHIDHNNMLPLSLGMLAGFCRADVSFLEHLPPTWLLVDSENSVTLPDYANKNWLITRDVRRNQGRERQQRYRDNHEYVRKPQHAPANDVRNVTPRRNAKVTPPRVAPAHASPSPSPTLTHTKKDPPTRLVVGSSGTCKNGNGRKIDPPISAHDAFEQIRDRYPKFTGRQDWLTAQHHAERLVEIGAATWPDLMAGVERYAAFATGGGVDGPRYVLTPGRFFSAADKPWHQTWELAPSKAQTKLNSNMQASAEWLADEEAKDHDAK